MQCVYNARAEGLALMPSHSKTRAEKVISMPSQEWVLRSKAKHTSCKAKCVCYMPTMSILYRYKLPSCRVSERHYLSLPACRPATLWSKPHTRVIENEVSKLLLCGVYNTISRCAPEVHYLTPKKHTSVTLSRNKKKLKNLKIPHFCPKNAI